MTKTEEIVIRSAIARLSGDTNTSEEVAKALANPALRIWLDTWVIAPLALVLPDCDELERHKLARGLSTFVPKRSAS